MTKQEVSEKYNIPMEMLDKYEKNNKTGEYNDTDLDKLSILMTLREAGFSDADAEKYIKLSKKERMDILKKCRSNMLDEIHHKEKQLENIDYLKYRIRNGGNENE